MKRVAVIQSCYIPWRGFFDLVSQCDEYIIYDQVAYRSGHWHNRNRIKTGQGAIWLTIPISARLAQPIEEVLVQTGWAPKHWKTIEQSYARSPFFGTESSTVKELYERADAETRLSAINEIFLRAIASRLRINTRIVRDTDYSIQGTRNERVLSACLAARATHYLSGPTAKAYLDTNMFAEAGVTVEWMDYAGYPEYPQNHGPFVADLSVIDLLLNTGPSARAALSRGRANRIGHGSTFPHVVAGAGP